MKRRNAEGTKPRRLVKRSKITEGIYGSTFLYLKFLLVWVLVLLADFILEFRFEYLWPFWLLMRSVYDSFKYQGLAFSVFFVCIAITSDVICYLFIPVQWLFFAASTYVWVQYVWHTERGICLPTVSLWLLFVYIEGSVRLREYKNLPFHLDLCRPFAAHCIGYPVVTLGFGFKSYVSYRLRMRRQVVVRKENDFYTQLLSQALPLEQQNLEKQKALSSKSQEEVISNGAPASQSASQQGDVSGTAGGASASSTVSATSASAAGVTSSTSSTSTASSSSASSSKHHSKGDHHKGAASSTVSSSSSSSSSSSAAAGTNHNHHHHHHDKDHSKSSKHNNSSSSSSASGGGGGSGGGSGGGGGGSGGSRDTSSATASSSPSTATATATAPSGGPGGAASPPPATIEEYQYIEQSLQKTHSVNNYEEENLTNEQQANKSYKQANGVTKAAKLTSQKDNNLGSTGHSSSSSSSSSSKKGKTNNATAVYANNKDEVISRLESDVKRLKADLQASRNCEQELRSQINSLAIEDKATKSEVYQLQQDNESFQNKLHNLVTSRQQDKQNLAMLERKLLEERKQKALADQQLQLEKKKRAEEARAYAIAQQSRGECTEMCKARRKELEHDSKQCRREIMVREDQLRQLEREAETLRQYKDAQNESEVLMSALSAMQDKNTHLENSLSAETRLKMDLFSALGEAKRQIEIQQAMLIQKEATINELKSKIAEVMALMPASASPTFTAMTSCNTPAHFSAVFTNCHSKQDQVLATSTLNPHASNYTPKLSDYGE